MRYVPFTKMVHCTVLPAGTQGSEALRVMRIVWHRRTRIKNLQSLHRGCPIWEPATHSHNGERNESACSSHFAGNCKKRKKPAANGKLAARKLKTFWKQQDLFCFSQKNCPFSCQIPESGRESGHQVGETVLKWLDNTVKPRPKIVWWNCQFSTKQQRKKPATSFLSQAYGAPEGIRTPGTWRRRTTTGRRNRT